MLNFSFRSTTSPKVLILMGSKSDLPIMTTAAQILNELEIPFDIQVVSAHRTPDLTLKKAESAAREGVEVIIAGAGASAALPGLIAAKTHLPVIGVPLAATALCGMDALLSIAQMPGGVPVATMAIGEAGAKNAGLYAARILALKHERTQQLLQQWIARLNHNATGVVIE